MGHVTIRHWLISLMAIGLLAGCRPSAEELAETTAQADHPELAVLHDQDQADRTDGHGDIDWPVVNRRDSLRRAQVDSLLAANQVRTAKDYYPAAMVFQHGSDTTAARKAYELAQQSVELDSTDTSAMWLMAAAWDRYQMRLEKPQWYGTQFVKDDMESPWRLYEVDTTAVTDEDRQRLGVRSLSEARARVEAMNAQ